MPSASQSAIVSPQPVVLSPQLATASPQLEVVSKDSTLKTNRSAVNVDGEVKKVGRWEYLRPDGVLAASVKFDAYGRPEPVQLFNKKGVWMNDHFYKKIGGTHHKYNGIADSLLPGGSVDSIATYKKGTQSGLSLKFCPETGKCIQAPLSSLLNLNLPPLPLPLSSPSPPLLVPPLPLLLPPSTKSTRSTTAPTNLDYGSTEDQTDPLPPPPSSRTVEPGSSDCTTTTMNQQGDPCPSRTHPLIILGSVYPIRNRWWSEVRD